MTEAKTAKTNSLVVAGAQFCFVGVRSMTCRTSETGLGRGVPLERGMTVTLSDSFIEANAHWLVPMLGNEDAQRDHWNEVRIMPGAWPEGQITTVPGNRDHDEQREAARQRAWKIQDPADRASALRAVEATYGKAPSTSVEIGNYRGGR